MKRLLLVAIISAAVLTAGCVNERYDKTALGSGIGAVVGGLAGSQLGDKSGTNVAIGAVVGALAGGAVGRYMDNQEHDLKQRLKAEREARMLNITRLSGNALKIGVASDASFAVDSSTLSQQAQTTFSRIAGVLRDYQKTAIHVIGNTDSTGSEQYNMTLSQERAQAVARFMTQRGVNAKRVLTWGRGESDPIASNATKAGRAANRRVDIIIKPIIKGQEASALSEPPASGR